MAEFRVVWEIDVEADDEIGAARAAVEIMKRPYATSIAHVFDVYAKRNGVVIVDGAGNEARRAVDLDKLDGKETE